MDVRKRIEELIVAWVEERLTCVVPMQPRFDPYMLTLAREVSEYWASRVRTFDEAHRHVGENMAKAIEAEIKL
mgnify:CR=1 FL=1